MLSDRPSLEGVYKKAQFHKYSLLRYCDFVVKENAGFYQLPGKEKNVLNQALNSEMSWVKPNRSDNPFISLLTG